MTVPPISVFTEAHNSADAHSRGSLRFLAQGIFKSVIAAIYNPERRKYWTPGARLSIVRGDF
ncbi:MAG: hypothetical protein ACRD4S_05285 [Candidatus Acidiferrales bacterium]